MIIAVDFDGTVVREESFDPSVQLKFVVGAKRGLLALKRAGHTLVLYSARANPCLWEDWRLNPMWSSFAPISLRVWEQNRALHRARVDQMVEFVERELPGVFSLVYRGVAKPVGVGMFIDSRDATALASGGVDWYAIAQMYGEE